MVQNLWSTFELHLTTFNNIFNIMTFPHQVSITTGKQILFDFINSHETFTTALIVAICSKYPDFIAYTTLNKTLRMLWLAGYIKKTARATWSRTRNIPDTLSISKLTDEAYGSGDDYATYHQNSERIKKESNNTFQ